MIFDGAEEEWDRAGKTRGIKRDKEAFHTKGGGVGLSGGVGRNWVSLLGIRIREKGDLLVRTIRHETRIEASQKQLFQN